MNSIMGMHLVVVPDKPRYQLPPDLAAILPWQMAHEFDAWAKSFLGSVPAIPDDLVQVIGNIIHCNPRVYERIKEQQIAPPDPHSLTTDYGRFMPMRF